MAEEKIRVLQLEDSESDAELVASELESGGLDCERRREQSREGFLAALRDFSPDLVLADYALPSYDGLSALKDAREVRPHLPFIFVTGNTGEDLAVESLKSGATDFVTKNSLGRLVPAVRRALRESAEAAAHAKAEAALRASETRYRIFFEQARDIILVLEIPPAGVPVIRDVNAESERAFGYSAAEMVGRPISFLEADEPAERLVQERLAHLRTRSPTSFIVRHRRKDGTVFTAEAKATEYEIGGARLAISVERDMTERLRAEAALRESFDMQSHLNAMLRASLANIPLGEKLSRQLGILLRIPWLAVEPRGAVFLVKGTSLVLAAHQGLPPSVQAACGSVPMGRCLCGRAAESRKAVASATVGPDHEIVYEGMAPHGHYCAPISAGSRTLGVLSLYLEEGAALDMDQEDFVRSAADILAANIRQAQTEGQLLQSQKMESIGRLAGGIAHDFNNILTAILGFSEILLGSLPAGDPRREDLQEIKSGTERAAGLTRQLLVFSRQQMVEHKVLDANVLVGDFMKMLRRVIGEDVTLEFRPAAGTCLVNSDGGRLEQVLMNLTVNARDAMPHGGRIVISTAVVTLGEEAAGLSPDLKPGAYAVLSVADTGHGMDAEVLKRVFEPFFTTKESGKGTGLGLSTVYGIARQSGGAVTAESAPGRGATFKVWLPIVAAASQRGPAAGPAPSPESRGEETILVLDDEAAIRKVIARGLGYRGYRVLEAATGQEALDVCASEHDIALLICDVILADGNSGPQVARRLSAVSPDIKVVFMSGYTDERVSQDEMAAQGDVFLQKPVSPEALALKVREVLDAPRRAAA